MLYFKEELKLDYSKLGIEPKGQPVYLKCYIKDPGNNIEINCADKKENTILIFPGGGYRGLSNRESEPIALQFLAAGYTVFVLDYSVSPAVFPRALFEAYTAISTIRKNADKWAVDVNKIAVCGFSAGGHLAASTGAFWDRDFVRNAGFTTDDHKPDALVLCYPVITGGAKRHAGSFKRLLGKEEPDVNELKFQSIERQVSQTFPRSFIWHTFEDEGVPVENSLLLANALAEQKIKFEMHIYPEGGHGLALSSSLTSRPEKQPPEKPQAWVKDCIKFLNENAFN